MFINGNGLFLNKKRTGVLVDDVEMPEMKINILDSKRKKMKNIKIINLYSDLKFYQFIHRNELEKSEHINDWLNIIFGQEQKLLKVGNKIKLYRKESEINFDCNKIGLNGELNMKSVDFGLLYIFSIIEEKNYKKYFVKKKNIVEKNFPFWEIVLEI